jgi:hypothetical protein
MSEMTRAKRRKNAKVAVNQYTRKDGTQVREHERIVNPRFIVECGDPYCHVFPAVANDPLNTSETCNFGWDMIVFDHDEAEEICEGLNSSMPEQLVENLECTLDEARWTPEAVRQ